MAANYGIFRGAVSVEQLSLGGDQLARAKLGPFVFFFRKAKAADHVPFHLDFIALVADVDINAGLGRFEGGGFGEVGLLVLVFDGVVGGAAIDVVAVDADTHGMGAPGGGERGKRGEFCLGV
jgi:hypothetical protein